MENAIGTEVVTTPDLEARFWTKVQKTDTCWLWLGKRDRHGYGRLYLGGGRAASREGFAHRVSFAIHAGAVGADVAVLHRCDNPPCVNPAHLFTGTHADNVRDMIAKGRNVSRARATVCFKGHPLTVENRIDYKRRRCCVICKREQWRDAMRKVRALDPEGHRARKREWAKRKREKQALARHGSLS